jgi:hypothetical protein
MIKLVTLLNEQLIGSLTRLGARAAKDTPDWSQDDFEPGNPTNTPQDRVAVTMKAARLLKQPTSNASRKIAKELHKQIQGIGGNSKIIMIIKNIKNIKELSSIITSYKDIYKTSLYNELSAEWVISWNSLWSAMQHINPSAEFIQTKYS